MQAKSLSLIGTSNFNKADIPLALKQAKGRKENSTIFAYSDDGITLCSWCKKKNFLVVIVSTRHPNCNDIPDEYKVYAKDARSIVTKKNVALKPEPLLAYNRNRGGVDTIDMMVRDMSCKRPTNR
jgi:Transposase IS4